MKLGEAIGILADRLDARDKGPDKDFDDAIKLGIKALKWREFYRETHPEMKWPLLPGETEE